MQHLFGITSSIIDVNQCVSPIGLNKLLGEIETTVGNADQVRFMLVAGEIRRVYVTRILEAFPKIKTYFCPGSPVENSKVWALPDFTDITKTFVKEYKGQAPILVADESLSGSTKIQIVSTVLGHAQLKTSTPGVDFCGLASKRVILIPSARVLDPNGQLLKSILARSMKILEEDRSFHPQSRKV